MTGSREVPWEAWLLHYDPAETTGLMELKCGGSEDAGPAEEGELYGITKPKCS